MKTLTNDFTPSSYKIGRTFQTLTIFVTRGPVADVPTNSVTIKNYDQNPSKFNTRAIGLINDIAHLQDDWDGEGSPAISAEVVAKAKAYIKILDSAGHEIFNVSPGSQGEVMVSMKKDEKYLEMLFYPSRTKYVKLTPGQRAEQGLLDISILSSLMTWLNGKQ